MSGPMADNTILDSANESEEGSDYTNQILSYLLGFSPKIDIVDDKEPDEDELSKIKRDA